MYGLILQSIVDLIKKKYGNDTWERVKKKARIDAESFSTHQQYGETIVQKIVKYLSEETGTSVEKLMEMFGEDFVGFISHYGYDRFLRVLGRHMRDFLNGLDNLHEYMKFSYPKLKAPSFFVEKETDTDLILHYRSKRKGYIHYVIGQIKEVGRVFYKIKVEIEIISQRQEMETQHVVLRLVFNNKQFSQLKSSVGIFDKLRPNPLVKTNLRGDTFFSLFPFHVVFNKDMRIISIGESLKQALTHAENEYISDVFNIHRPLIPFDWETIIAHANNTFELGTIEPIKRLGSGDDSPLDTKNFSSKTGDDALTTTKTNSSTHDETFKLRGQMIYVEQFNAIAFLPTPILENLDVMFHSGFYLNDLSLHDGSRDLVLVGTQQSAELKLAIVQEKQKSKQLEENLKQLDSAMKRGDDLLYRLIPKKIADRLRSGEPVINLCEVFSLCTVLFSDVVGFTSTCSKMNPIEVISLLNEMYTRFDGLLEIHNVYKVETIGDAYMVVGGVPNRINNHASEVVRMALGMLDQISQMVNPVTQKSIKMRIGCHSGSVVAGVVGLKMPRYCLFGETVNVASKMEATSEAMRVHITERTKNLIDAKEYDIVERGILELTGKDSLKTFLIQGKLDFKGNKIACPFMILDEELKPKKDRHLDPKWEGFKLLNNNK